MGDLVAYRYRIIRKIGEGAFGQVYEVAHMSDPTSRYVAKLEQLSSGHNTLQTEKAVMKELRK
jgi:serine/threonine protein kinase